MSNCYDVVIEFDEFITRAELNTILTEIELAIESYLLRRAGLSPLEGRQVGGTYLQIRAASSGSIIIAVTAIVAGFLAPSLKQGWGKGEAAKETQRIGKSLSNVMGAALRPIRKALEQLEKRLREENSHDTKLSVRPSAFVARTGSGKEAENKRRRGSSRKHSTPGITKASPQDVDVTLKRKMTVPGPLKITRPGRIKTPKPEI
jgi:hypothetical protein